MAAMIIRGLIAAPVLIGWVPRAAGRSRGSGDGGDSSFADLSGWLSSVGGGGSD